MLAGVGCINSVFVCVFKSHMWKLTRYVLMQSIIIVNYFWKIWLQRPSVSYVSVMRIDMQMF